MLAASPSPRLTPSQAQTDSTGFLSPKSSRRSTKAASPIVRPHSTHVYPDPSPGTRYSSSTSTNTNTSTQSTTFPSQCSPTERRSFQPHSISLRSTGTQTSPTRLSPTPEQEARRRPQMVDAQTQYSSPQVNEQEKEQHTQSLSATHTAQTSTPTPASQISRLHINEATGNTSQPQSQPAQSSTNTSRTASSESTSAAPTSTTRTKPYDPVADAAMSVAPTGTNTIAATSAPPPSSTKEPGTDKSEKESVPHTPSHSTKRNHSTSADARPETLLHNASATSANLESSSKKPRPESQPSKLMPPLYWHASTKDLVLLISSMLMELIRYNDSLTLSTSNLTRFHSRAPPGISVHDYLSRLTTHATLSPPILLSMVYYIDKLCALYPAFTISSLTVHRFLITAATVASKGLSDSFWTNKTYARVGGVSVKELALLELEFLIRIQWRIVPVPEVLGRYYRRLVERTIGYELEGGEEGMSEGEEGDGMAATRVDGHVEPQWMREQEQGRGRDERQ